MISKLLRKTTAITTSASFASQIASLSRRMVSIVRIRVFYIVAKRETLLSSA